MPEFGTKEWIQENDNRITYLRRLYLLDGRDNPTHPDHCLFTGLYEKRKNILIELDRQQQLKIANSNSD